MTLDAQRTLLAEALAQCDALTPAKTRNERRSALLAFDQDHPEVLYQANHAICHRGRLQCRECNKQQQQGLG